MFLVNQVTCYAPSGSDVQCRWPQFLGEIGKMTPTILIQKNYSYQQAQLLTQ